MQRNQEVALNFALTQKYTISHLQPGQTKNQNSNLPPGQFICCLFVWVKKLEPRPNFSGGKREGKKQTKKTEQQE